MKQETVNIKKRSAILHITFFLIVIIGKILHLFVRMFDSDVIFTTNAFTYVFHYKSYLINLRAVVIHLILQEPILSSAVSAGIY